MRVVAVIPVRGRLPLLKHTIRRLYNANGVNHVICIGETFEEQMCCQYEGAQFIKHRNNPLGKKWNRGFIEAKLYDPDAVLFVGSSDWVSPNWVEETTKHLDKYDLIGKRDFQLLDIGDKNTYRFCHWMGYEDKRRIDEPIGIGRILSARILDKMNWRPIQDDLNSSIDYSMYNRILGAGGKVKIVNDPGIHSLSISTYKWPNMHKFNDHYSNKLPSLRVPHFIEILNKYYPEYRDIVL